MKRLILWIDLHKQSFLFFKWNAFSVLAVIGASLFIAMHWKDAWVSTILNNIFVYFPNYLTHEILGHNMVGNVLFRLCYALHYQQAGEWLATLAGNGVETLVPFVILLLLLQTQGGRWGIPPIMYWLASTFYGAGEYVADARACSLPLTSSDMMTNYKPGEICGDWHHILEPLGLLNYDQWFAYSFMFLAGLCLVLALYSVWYYWTHTDQYILQKPQFHKPVEDDWRPPNIYTPQ